MVFEETYFISTQNYKLVNLKIKFVYVKKKKINKFKYHFDFT